MGAKTANASLGTISWPRYGRVSQYRRDLLLFGGGGGILAVALSSAVTLLLPQVAAVSIPVGAAVVMLVLLAAQARAQSRARQTEVSASFAGLVVICDGYTVRVADDPMIGEFDTRHQALRAAMVAGCWTAVVQAYDRYYVLRGTRNRPAAGTPISFRNRAVMGIVPAVHAGEELIPNSPRLFPPRPAPAFPGS